MTSPEPRHQIMPVIYGMICSLKRGVDFNLLMSHNLHFANKDWPHEDGDPWGRGSVEPNLRSTVSHSP